MGLDTSHDCWHGPYSSFKRFRDEVAVAAKEHCGYVPDYDAHPLRAFYGWWDQEWFGQSDPDGHEPSHILDVFFIHSDCEGWIFPQQAGPLADALDNLVGYLDDEEGNHRLFSSREALRTFVAGLRDAADRWEVVGFH